MPLTGIRPQEIDRLHNPAPSPGMVEVTVDDPAQVDPALENAVVTVKDAAIRHRTGIMITRTGPGRYIVRAHPAVPYGLIRERHE